MGKRNFLNFREDIYFHIVQLKIAEKVEFLLKFTKMWCVKYIYF